MAKKASKTAQQTEKQARVREGRNLNIWIDADILDAFDKLCEVEGRTKTAQLERVLIDALTKVGLWSAK